MKRYSYLGDRNIADPPTLDQQVPGNSEPVVPRQLGVLHVRKAFVEQRQFLRYT
jgi:hypothetical protein